MTRGIYTTEFWLTVVAAVITVLVSAGVLSAEEGQQLTGATAQVIQAVAHLMTVLAPFLGAAVYTWSRTRVKQSQK